MAMVARRFLKEIEGLFVQVLLLAREMGVLKMGTIGLDGTKIHANASRHSALSYEHAGKTAPACGSKTRPSHSHKQECPAAFADGTCGPLRGKNVNLFIKLASIADNKVWRNCRTPRSA
jgi:hypothetical protein